LLSLAGGHRPRHYLRSVADLKPDRNVNDLEVRFGNLIMKVKYIDKASGKVIAEPEFFQRAAAWSGAFTVGGQDNAMLARIVTLVADYTSRNYQEAMGGPSGAPAELVNATE